MTNPSPKSAPTNAEIQRAVARASARKEDHIRLAAEQRREIQTPRPSAPEVAAHPPRPSEFDDLEFLHHALDAINVAAVDLTTKVADWTWQAPLYINGMTGGAETAMRVNRALAIAARETDVPIASGSVGIAIDDPSTAASFRVIREENPNGFVMANVGAGRPADHGQRAVDLLEANALQLHLNAVQETIMPEGSREFSNWLRGVERTVAATSVPVIVKEVGFGLSRRTLQQLREVGVHIADVSGSGGTNFARIESARGGDAFGYLGSFGQSAAACLLDAPTHFPNLLASGGVRHPLDVVKALALGARAVGVAGPFLLPALEGTPEDLTAEIASWLEQIRMLHAMLGAASPRELATTDLLVRGRLHEFATLRGIDVTVLSHRSDARATSTGVSNTGVTSTEEKR
ncbi:type 2 isopentenyl-diphosphate Delta-isomerase [Gulosibacter molinativorax]|uniref:Isopentenyl-diphosphate delta-isomerase n=1 Tax=Gulosibacter molinativorax TaxID=256821 RepID=A0ABT7C8X5_9MICO|nr:type 2 isopentenyl-diphosphate Delta-isomerase [Gulosibacter molinativorax]MDJ1371666.1 type 2 isopentenyl-diphosphate Delta-isomerase [Gulosibacter molinativorax]QUY63088.1 Isopentenyl-diphosphate delta-isomerase [Gulosibacter molinativorax]